MNAPRVLRLSLVRVLGLSLVRVVGISLVVGALGCASTAPPSELLRARVAYKYVATSPASRLAPADLHTARETLNVAERSFDENGDAAETKDMAYAAQRRAEYAEVKARTVSAMQQQRDAAAREQALRDQLTKTNAVQLANARQQLEDAERRTAQASSELNKIASVRNDARGLVISLSGSVLFASGKSTLLPAAKKRLSQVANVLSQRDANSKLRIEGYTDTSGPARANERLSQARAVAVRDYLVSLGLASDRMTAEGMGPSNPIAENATAEGRANNRRVEIIVQGKESEGDIR